MSSRKKKNSVSHLPKTNKTPESLPTDFFVFLKRNLGFFFFVTVLIFFIFMKIYSFGLTYFDDQIWIEDYKGFFQHWGNIGYFFKNADFISGVFYRPLLNMSFLIDAKIGGGALWSYRVTNVLLHITNSFLIYVLLLRLNTRQGLARFLALFFVCHPALTQSVAWIPGRTDSLFAFFSLVTFLSFMSYQDRKLPFHVFLCSLFLVLSFLTKETAIVLPVMCLLYLILWKKDRNLKNLSFWIILFASLTVGWLAVRSQMIQPVDKTPLLTLLKSLIDNLPSAFVYFGKIFFPFNLCVMPILRDVTYVYAWLALGLFLGILILSKSFDVQKLLFGLFWFILFILPSLVLSFIEHEYRLYMPMIGILICLSVLNIDQLLKGKQPIIVGTIIIVVFSVVTFLRTDEFKNRLTFWHKAVECAPHSPLAHRNLAAMFYLDGKYQEAETEWLKTVDLNPNEPMVHNNLGLIYMGQAQYDKAEKEFLYEINVNPAYGNAYFNFSLLKFQQGQNEAAVGLLKKAIYFDPKHIKALTVLVDFYNRNNQPEESKFYQEQLKNMGVSYP